MWKTLKWASMYMCVYACVIYWRPMCQAGQDLLYTSPHLILTTLQNGQNSCFLNKKNSARETGLTDCLKAELLLALLFVFCPYFIPHPIFTAMYWMKCCRNPGLEPLPPVSLFSHFGVQRNKEMIKSKQNKTGCRVGMGKVQEQK